MQYCLRHCKEGSSSEYTMEEFEYKDSVRPCKISSTFHRRENNISTNLNMQHDIMPWPGAYSNRFSSTSSTHNARRFLDTSCQSRDRVPPIMGFSLMWSWVTQPCLGLLDYRQVQTVSQTTLDIHPLYKGTRFLLFPSRAQSNPSPVSSSNTQNPG